MKKEEKVKIIKWYIKTRCKLDKIQTEKENTDDLNTLEKLVMNDRAYLHDSSCSSCWYNERDFDKKCKFCSHESNYTFPYGYWKTVYKRDNDEI